jgi:hypothetical protein
MKVQYPYTVHKIHICVFYADLLVLFCEIFFFSAVYLLNGSPICQLEHKYASRKAQNHWLFHKTYVYCDFNSSKHNSDGIQVIK